MKQTKYRLLFGTSNNSSILTIRISDLPKDLLPDDKITTYFNVDEHFTYFTVERPYEEDDEEYNERLKREQQTKEVRDKMNYERYLVLHERYKDYTPNEGDKT